MTIAVIFVPAGHIATYANQCLDYCQARGYEVAGLVTADWAAAAAMLYNRTAGVLVVSSAEHIPHDAEPRIEIAAQHAPAPTPRHERTRLVRRTVAK